MIDVYVPKTARELDAENDSLRRELAEAHTVLVDMKSQRDALRYRAESVESRHAALKDAHGVLALNLRHVEQKRAKEQAELAEAKAEAARLLSAIKGVERQWANALDIAEDAVAEAARLRLAPAHLTRIRNALWFVQSTYAPSTSAWIEIQAALSALNAAYGDGEVK